MGCCVFIEKLFTCKIPDLVYQNLTNRQHLIANPGFFVFFPLSFPSRPLSLSSAILNYNQNATLAHFPPSRHFWGCQLKASPGQGRDEDIHWDRSSSFLRGCQLYQTPDWRYLGWRGKKNREPVYSNRNRTHCCPNWKWGPRFITYRLVNYRIIFWANCPIVYSLWHSKVHRKCWLFIPNDT